MNRYQFSQPEQAILEGLPTPHAVFQLVDGRVVPLALSAGFVELLGADSLEEAYSEMARNPFTHVHPDDVARVGNAVSRFMRDGGCFESIYRLQTGDGGSCRMIHALGKFVYVPSGFRLAYVWYTDEGAYTEEREGQNGSLNAVLANALHEESILKTNYYDELTGLPNLSYFFDLAEAGKSAMLRRGETAVLLYIDLNGMKYFNHKYSFAEGDKLLRSFSQLLVSIYGGENCGHIAADRFAVFTAEDGLEDTLKLLFREARKINGGNTLPVRVGVYSTRIEDVPVSSAYDRAKIACDKLKKTDVSSFSYYSQAMIDEMKRRQYIRSNIDRAISEKWIQVYYQPIVRAISGKVCDVEALARWIDPNEGFLSPAEFIPYLEDAGLIYKLDLFVLEQVLEKIKKQAAEGLFTIPHSINLSRSDFDACDIVEEIGKRVDEAGVSRDRITIEITESVIGRNFAFMKTQVERFQSLGFPVWMDDFGSGYSSLDVLQSIKFNLLKFDMGFMQKLDEGEDAKIILRELMKMATALGLDTVCEGVETLTQVRFLQEIGCSKFQGYYFSRPVPLEAVTERHEKGIWSEAENPEESAYYDSIGRVNLYDLGVIANEEADALHNSFNTLPMGIVEVQGDRSRFSRSNQSYRDFIKRFFGFDLSNESGRYEKYSDAFMKNIVKTCCEQGLRAFYDETMPDGTVVHSFARRIGVNPVTGTYAVAIAVISITDPEEGASYAEIARALAADYYSIYVIDLDTDHYIEYSSRVGGEELSMEHHGEDFFESSRQNSHRIYTDDRENFYAAFTKENIVRALDQQGVFTAAYRLVDTGVPVYVSMKVSRLQRDGNRIIMGISVVDDQMKQKAHFEELRKERDTLARVMALSDDFLSLYAVDPATGHFVQFGSSEDYDSLGVAKEGDDFFHQAITNAEKHILPEDWPAFREQFQFDRMIREVREHGNCKIQYRLLINGQVRPVTLKLALFRENGEQKMVVGVRAWKMRGAGAGQESARSGKE